MNHTPIIPELDQAIDFVTAQFGDSETGDFEILNELDGAPHFENNIRRLGVDLQELIRQNAALKYNAKTLFRAALSHRMAPEKRILHIDYITLRVLRRQKSKENNDGSDLDYLRDIFKKINHLPPGVYRTTFSPGLLEDMLQRHDDGSFPTLNSTSPPTAHHPADANDNAALLDRHGRPYSQSRGNHPLPPTAK